MPAAGGRVARLMCVAAAGLTLSACGVSCAFLKGRNVAANQGSATENGSEAEAPAPEKASEKAPPPKEPATRSATRPVPRKRRGPLRKRVLFIGNSYTSFNDMPLMVRKLAEAARERERLSYKQFTVGGCTLAKHWRQTGARMEIRKGGWDYVVLQEQSTRPIAQREIMHRDARLFCGEIMAAKAKTVFFMTWARLNRPHDQDTLAEAYVSIAKELNAQVAPVGLAWQMARAQMPTAKLHAADKSHPTPMGSYLAACVFYATLYDKTPLGLPGRFLTTTKSGKRRAIINLRPQDAVILQQVAWDAVQRVRRQMR